MLNYQSIKFDSHKLQSFKQYYANILHIYLNTLHKVVNTLYIHKYVNYINITLHKMQQLGFSTIINILNEYINYPNCCLVPGPFHEGCYGYSTRHTLCYTMLVWVLHCAYNDDIHQIKVWAAKLKAAIYC